MNENIFSCLFRDFSLETFYAEYWEKKPLYIASEDPLHYEAILGRLDLDNILCARYLHDGDIRIFKSDSKVPFNTYTKQLQGLSSNRKAVHPSKALELYFKGNTLIFQNVHRYSETFSNVVRSLELETNLTAARANIYATPPENHGFGKHWDHLCSIILQLDGEKEWQIFEEEMHYPNPLLGPGQSKGKKTDILFTKTLKPGDLLYIPRGFAHAPRTNKKHSVHVNIAFRPIYTSELLEHFLKHILTEETSFRKGIHPITNDLSNFNVAKLGQLAAEYDWGKALEQVQNENLIDRNPLYVQWWDQLSKLNNLSESTIFTLNPMSKWTYVSNKEHVELNTYGKKIFLSKDTEVFLSFLSKCKNEFNYSDLVRTEVKKPKALIVELIKTGIIYVGNLTV